MPANPASTDGPEGVHFFSGVLLVSKDPARLAAFYRDALGIPLEEEQHGDTLPHWGATLGELHFAIHPIEDFPDGESGVGAVKLAFTVFDVRAKVASLREAGVAIFREPHDTGFFVSAMVRDPDGNLVELTELCDAWFESLEKRRAEGRDLLSRWREHRARGERPTTI